MVQIIQGIQAKENPDLKVLGILPTKYDGRTTLSDSTIAAIEKQGLPIFKTRIRISVEAHIGFQGRGFEDVVH